MLILVVQASRLPGPKPQHCPTSSHLRKISTSGGLRRVRPGFLAVGPACRAGYQVPSRTSLLPQIPPGRRDLLFCAHARKSCSTRPVARRSQEKEWPRPRQVCRKRGRGARGKTGPRPCGIWRQPQSAAERARPSIVLTISVGLQKDIVISPIEVLGDFPRWTRR